MDLNRQEVKMREWIADQQAIANKLWLKTARLVQFRFLHESSAIHLRIQAAIEGKGVKEFHFPVVTDSSVLSASMMTYVGRYNKSRKRRPYLFSESTAGSGPIYIPCGIIKHSVADSWLIWILDDQIRVDITGSVNGKIWISPDRKSYHSELDDWGDFEMPTPKMVGNSRWNQNFLKHYFKEKAKTNERSNN